MTGTGSSIALARICLVFAALLWSLGSVFMRLLREPLGLGLDSPSLSPIQIAFFRGLFGGLIMLALVRRTEIRFRPAMMAMVIAFSVMSVLYLSALGLGAAANAIFLQNTAPVWVYLLAVLFLGERADWRGIQIVALATLGAVVIVVGGWPRRLPPEDKRRAGYVLLMGLGSGFVYAVVVLSCACFVSRVPPGSWHSTFSAQRRHSVSTSLCTMDQVRSRRGHHNRALGNSRCSPFSAQLQMALPYWLFTRGLGRSRHKKRRSLP